MVVVLTVPPFHGQILGLVKHTCLVDTDYRILLDKIPSVHEHSCEDDRTLQTFRSPYFESHAVANDA
jgi:hypothetical protein